MVFGYFLMVQKGNNGKQWVKNYCLKAMMKDYVKKDYVQKDWWKNVTKDYLDITIAFDFCWFLIVAKESVKWVAFLFLLTCFLPRAHSRWKKNGYNIQAKEQKIVNLHENEGFSVVLKARSANFACILNLEYVLLIFKNCIGRNVWNLGYRGESRQALGIGWEAKPYS